MTIALGVILGAVLFLLYQSRVLPRLSLFADEALADQIIEAGRLKTAQARLELYEGEERHMCLTPACRNPVAGKSILAHCEQHLELYERGWLDDNLESRGIDSPSEEGEHPTVKRLREIGEARTKELVQQNASNKMQTLTDARILVKNARSQEREREAYLPRKLRARIEWSEKEQQKALGGSWIPPSLLDLINQKADKNDE